MRECFSNIFVDPLRGKGQVLTAKSHLIRGIDREELGPGILKDRAYVRTDLMRFQFFIRCFPKKQFTCQLPLIESRDQSIQTADQSCFSTAAFSCQDKAFALTDLQADVFQRIILRSCLVLETEVFDCYDIHATPPSSPNLPQDNAVRLLPTARIR